MPFHDEQLQFVIWLSQFRGPYIDPILRFLNYFDSEYFIVFLIPVVWFGISYRWGLRIFSLLYINSICNYVGKRLLKWPRPSQEVPGLGMFDFDSYGFPSGGAEISMLLGCVLIYYGKSRITTILGILYILLVSFSRIYLGVHFPLDILGGWAIGFSLFLLFLLCRPPIENFLKRIGPIPSLLLTEFLFFLYLMAASWNSYFLLAGSIVIPIGAFLTFKYKLDLLPPRSFRERLLPTLIALATVFIPFVLWPTDFHPFAFKFLLSLWLSLGLSPFCKWLLCQK